jgi:ribosomal protein S27AE
MVSATEDNHHDAPPPVLEADRFTETRQGTRNHLHPPCPACGSRMVRSRDLRDLCLVCGYLQAQA